MRTTPKAKPVPKPKLGLRAWMERVLVECDRAEVGFDADAVHDLRVALRRCRSLADGLTSIDPDPSWKDMKRAGKKLFQALGELRDMQVVEEWIEKLSLGVVEDAANRASTENPIDAVAVKLLDYIHAREAASKQLALKDLNQFDRKQWRRWSRELPRRAARVRPGSVVYLHLALEKWTAAYDLHKLALRTRSRVALHTLRIGIKRFRYTVENFLPQQHVLWGSDLKELQDLLGEVHDLDVLWATAVEIGAFPDAESRSRWLAKVSAEREKRVLRYRELMVGRESLWREWRAQLPSGGALRAAALARLRVWAGYLDPDFVHSQRVARLALVLYDGLRAQGLVAAGFRKGSAEDPRADEEREVLQAAAFMHDVGKAKGAENHQKKSYRMIRELVRPLGWSARELELTAVVARYHRGALPHPRRKTLQLLELPDRRVAVELAGVLRLAKALDSRNGHEPRIQVQRQDDFVLVRAAGYSALERSAEGVAAARHLLETVLRRPVLVRALRVAVGRAPQRKPVLVARS